MQSRATSEGWLEISLERVATPQPGPNDVVIRVEAAPINPSDLGLLFGFADMTRAEATGTPERPVVRAPIPEGALRMLEGRLDEAMPVGNEGAGTVVAAGEAPEAQALLGRTVAAVGGAMYSQYRVVPHFVCLPLHDGTTAEQGASCFVNPLTALGMVETMRAEGHSALVHTAAASNLGQMLNRICLADDVELVNVVRRTEQVELLRGIGARHVVNSGEPDFRARLTDAIEATGATIAFDATGGGRLAGQILSCMEAALIRKASSYSRYGSTTHKQVYLYGRLDRSPTELPFDMGFAWGVGGWLLTPFLQKIDPETGARLRRRVADEIGTTFASHYSRRVSLREALELEHVATYGRQATGEKYLIEPWR
ncbi:MAG: zinc-binding dehydrogenase [Spirochaetaceae bacterium]|nr:zinc-binding dehydrogenase [Spirochaetaceae bacterium]